MPRRTIYAEVTPDGGLRWQHDEGTIEVLPKIASAVAALEPLTSVEVQGEYRRVDARTRVLKADKLRVGWSPLHRALRAAVEQDHAELERFAQAYAARTDAGGWVLRAARARQAGRDEEAMRCLEEALRAGLSRDINVSTNPGDVFAAVWGALPRERSMQKLATELRECLMEQVWQQNIPSGPWLHPLASCRWESDDSIRFPGHFGGPRPEPAAEPVRAWATAELDALARAHDDREELEHVRRLPANQLGIWRKKYARENADPEGGIVRSCALTWVDFALAGEHPSDQAWSELGSDLVWLRDTPKQQRAAALAVDAVAILAAEEPALAVQVHQVVFVSATLRSGRALVRLKRGDFCLLDAPDGAFGAWQVTTGALAALLERLPSSERKLGAKAMSDPRSKETIAPGTFEAELRPDSSL